MAGDVTDQTRLEALTYGSQEHWDDYVRSSSFQQGQGHGHGQGQGHGQGGAATRRGKLSGKAHLSSLGQR